MDRLEKTSVGLEEMLTRFSEARENENVFTLLGKKFHNFSPATQSWIEDEILRIYLEAKNMEKAREGKDETIICILQNDVV